MSGIANDHPRDRLSPYFDDELQVDERAAVDRHLAGCPECRDELEAMQRIAAAFASEPVPEMAEDLEVRLLHRLDLATILPLCRRSFFVPASIAATVAAVGLVSLILWKQGGVAPLPSTTESAQEREQTAEPERPSGTRVQQAPALEGAPGAAPADKLEPSTKNEIATNVPETPPPSPEAAFDQAATQAAPEELAKLKSDARQDDADTARQRSLGYAGSTADTQAKEAYAPVPGRDERSLARAAAKPLSPVVAGALGRTLAPACAGGTFGASDEGRWSVADLPRGLDDLRTVLGAVGGRLESFEPQTTRRATVLIPRECYAEWIRAAKLQGVTGLADEFPDGDGDCVRQQIRIEQPQRP
jgi:Putative zinc-finger